METRSHALQTMLSLDSALFEHGKQQPGRSNHLLGNVLRGLIEAGATFDEGDLAAIEKHCGVRSCLGKFDMGEYVYTTAVRWANATVCKSWEIANNRPAWMWPGVASITEVSTFENRHCTARKIATFSRLCMDSAVQIDGQWWRVYGIEADTLKLVHHEGDDGLGFSVPAGPGGKRWRISRDEWAKLRAADIKARKDAKTVGPVQAEQCP